MNDDSPFESFNVLSDKSFREICLGLHKETRLDFIANTCKCILTASSYKNTYIYKWLGNV